MKLMFPTSILLDLTDKLGAATSTDNFKNISSEKTKAYISLSSTRLRVSRFGLAVRRYRLVSGRTSVRYRFGSPFSSKRL